VSDGLHVTPVQSAATSRKTVSARVADPTSIMAERPVLLIRLEPEVRLSRAAKTRQQQNMFEQLWMTFGAVPAGPDGPRPREGRARTWTVLGLAALALTAPAPLRAQGASADVASPTSWPDRPAVSLGGYGALELRARVQSQFVVRDDTAPADTFSALDDRLSFQRGRVGVAGELFDRVEFQIEREIESARPWRDVFADVTVSRQLHVRAGHFKVPFSREQSSSMYELDFTSRSAAIDDLVPLRGTGMMVHGQVIDRAVKYQAGVFEPTRQPRWTAAGPRLFAGRITVSPLRKGRHRGSDTLQLSAAWLRRPVEEGRTSPDGHLAMGPRFFEPVYAQGVHTLVGGGAVWTVPEVTLAGEVLQASNTRTGQAIDGGNLSNLVSRGGYASGAWHLIRGKGRRRGRAPFREVDLTGRLDWLRFGSASTTDTPSRSPRADHVAPLAKRTLTLGITWRINRWMAVHTNAVRERVVDSLGLSPLAAAPIWSAVVRSQVVM
jgi:hypothetical protein